MDQTRGLDREHIREGSTTPVPELPIQPLVSVLFISYKRVDLLEKAVLSFIQNTAYPNLELIISDDASPPDMQERIRKLPADKYSLAEKNQGLGANINKGMRMCVGDYILMIQDDWICGGPQDYLTNVISLLSARPDIGIVNFTMTMLEGKGDQIDGFPALLYPLDPQERAYPYLYTDQPHIRRREVNDLVGPYLEHRDMVKCEQDYERKWDSQRVYRSAMFPEYTMSVFDNHGVERSIREARLRNKMDRALMPVALTLKPHPWLFRLGKAFVRACQGMIELVRGPQ